MYKLGGAAAGATLAGGTLAFTGFPVFRFVALGLALIVVGALMARSAGHRHRHRSRRPEVTGGGAGGSGPQAPDAVEELAVK